MIDIVEGPIDRSAVVDAVRGPGFGALLVFDGVTRDHFEGRPVVRLEYEAYRPMAVAELQAIASEARQQWPGTAIACVHRVGLVPLGEASVVIAVGAPHRDAAYGTSRFVLEALKARVPIWKKEIYADGHAWKANAPADHG